MDKLQLDFLSSTQLASVTGISEANNYFASSAGQLAFSQSESTLYIDYAARGRADMAIELTKVTALNVADFV